MPKNPVVGMGDNIGQTVVWNRAKLEAFKTAIQAADPEGVVMFQGNEFFVPYAKYLIEYLEGEL